jgi:membrane protease YdiL (CAAX protease family)
MSKETDQLSGKPAWLVFLPDFLFEIDRRWPERYTLKAWLLSLLGTAVLSAAVLLLIQPSGHPDIRTTNASDIIILVVASPVIETLLLGLLLTGLDLIVSEAPAVLISAVTWGLLHSLASPTWGLIVWWPFLIMSIAFVTWRHVSLPHAFAVVASIHALQNGVAAFLLVLLGHS